MKKIAIIIGDSNGSYPVPAVRGSAISILVEHLLIENSNNNKEIFLEVYSFFDENAEKEASKLKNVNFHWIKVPKFIKVLDEMCFKFCSKFFKNKKTISFKTPFSLIIYILYVSKKLKRENYDKVIFENNMLLAWIIKISNYKGKFYYHLHNVPRKNFRCRDIFNKCSGYFCVSKYVANEIMKESNPIGPITKDKINILYNCIDINKFYKVKDTNKLEEVRKKYNIKEKDKVLIFVGRISREKGLHCVIDAMQYLKSENIKLIIVGSFLHNVAEKDSYQKYLEEKTEEYTDKIIWTGYINQDELVNIYNIADIAVLPSIWEEPAGLTMIEALACGIPVITTYSGGIPEYVKGYAILIDRKEDMSIELASIIDKILKDNKIYSEEMFKTRENGIKTKYNSKRYYENFVNLIK